MTVPAAARGPRINHRDLVMVTISGQIAHPVGRANPYRIGYDGVPRVLPGTGGIVLNQRIGDRCVGLAGDHIEPGVSLHNNGREVVGPRNGPNTALMTYACIGNTVRVLSGACTGQTGVVTGMRLIDYPRIEALNCSPRLLAAWGIRARDGRLQVPASHLVPASLMGSGLGKNNTWMGDYDIQLSDAALRRRYRLGSLRFGDLVAVLDADNRRGPSFRSGRVTLGIIVHGDSTVSGHGPGFTPLLTGPASLLQPVLDARANLAAVLGIREPAPLRNYPTLAEAAPAPPAVSTQPAKRQMLAGSQFPVAMQ